MDYHYSNYMNQPRGNYRWNRPQYGQGWQVVLQCNARFQENSFGFNLTPQEAQDIIMYSLLDPFGCPVKFLSCAFTNIRDNGVICVVATDICSLLAKNCNVTLRNYAAHVIRTEYVEELGGRVLIAAAARAAALCNKGVEVLYTVNREHFIMACLRVKRGQKSADHSIQQICNVIHCEICEERVCQPNTQHSVENLYSLLPCRCHTENPGKTAVQIGPLWCGNIFDVNFVLAMYKLSIKEELSKSVVNLLSTIVLEAACPDSLSQQSTITRNLDDIFKHDRERDNLHVSETSSDSDQTSGNASKDNSFSNTGSGYSTATDQLEKTKEVSDFEELAPNAPEKLKVEDVDHHRPVRATIPMFYYNLHKKKLPGLNLPKVSKVIAVLQKSGFQASRTHFCSTAIRTNSSFSQMYGLLEKDLGTT